MNILPATTIAHYEAAKKLINAYTSFLDEDLNFQQIELELASLPKMYGGQNGCILLAEENGEMVGIVALRKKSQTVCEMKRLFVLSSFLGLGLGKQLSVAITEKAKEMGFKEMVLDTLQRLVPALQLYKSLGFEEVEAYYENPLPEVVYMRLKLF